MRIKNHKSEKIEVIDRVRYCMEVEKAFLDPEFNLDKLCRMVLSNTTSVSNAINKTYGMNFRKVVNSYRAKYAHDLMKVNPCMDVYEVMIQSGFRSIETFRLSFFLEYGTTPRICRTDLRFSDLKSPSK